MTFVGAGSVEFTRNVATDLCTYPDFRGGLHLALYDISADRLAHAQRLVSRISAQTGANATCIFVPAAFAPDAMLEAAAARVPLVVCITENIPALDMLRVYHVLRSMGVRLIGPNCPGVTSVGEAKVGIIPGNIHARGPVGLVSRSGTLTYEVVQAMTDAGLGQTSCVGIGGDPIIGTGFIDVLDMLNQDDETEAIVMIGEIGGEEEEKAAAFCAREVRKPMAAFIAGRTAPPGRRMGHAGAIISGGAGTAESKREALEAAGIRVADSPSHIPQLLRDAGVR